MFRWLDVVTDLPPNHQALSPKYAVSYLCSPRAELDDYYLIPGLLMCIALPVRDVMKFLHFRHWKTKGIYVFSFRHSRVIFQKIFELALTVMHILPIVTRIFISHAPSLNTSRKVSICPSFSSIIFTSLAIISRRRRCRRPIWAAGFDISHI